MTMTDQLALWRPAPVALMDDTVLLDVVPEHLAVQSWTTTWTLTMTRTPVLAPRATAAPIVDPPEPLFAALVHDLPVWPVTQPVSDRVTQPVSRRVAPPAAQPIELPVQPARTSTRAAAPAPVSARTPTPTRTRTRAARAPQRTRARSAPALVRFTLVAAFGVCLVTAGVRAHALDSFGMTTPDNRTVLARLADIVGLSEPASGD
jgi:hypothetical protein